MTIIKHDNNEYLFKILRSKLGINLKEYKDDSYFVLTSDHLIYGICRITKLTNSESQDNNQFIKPFNLKKSHINKDIYYLSGIWVNEDIRNQGYGTKLINKRLEITKKDDIIITDIQNKSSLKNKYKALDMELIKDDEDKLFFKLEK